MHPRVAIVSFAAASAGLSMAAMSLAKLFLLLTALLVLLRDSHKSIEPVSWQDLRTPKLIIFILALLAVSLLWTTSPSDQALEAFVKYGKFLVIPALLILIRSRPEAILALAVFLGFQVFLLLSTWLLYFHFPVIWASGKFAKEYFAVFSSYLDQSIMSAVVGALFWHLRSLAPNRPSFYGAIAISILAFWSVFFIFVGRTGQIVGLTLIALAVFWGLPKRYRLASLAVPPLIVMLALSFGAVPHRFITAVSELSSYMDKPAAVTSTGVRLSFWKTSLEAIAQKPLAGSGVGSWTAEYNRIELQKNADFQVLKVASNPHQEFLLWGVQLGVGGVVLLLTFMGSVMKDFLNMDPPVARAGQSVAVALAVSCLFNSSLYDANIGTFFCLTLGVLLAFGVHGRAMSTR